VEFHRPGCNDHLREVERRPGLPFPSLPCAALGVFQLLIPGGQPMAIKPSSWRGRVKARIAAEQRGTGVELIEFLSAPGSLVAPYTPAAESRWDGSESGSCSPH